MANLNIPFLLLQPSLCEFAPSIQTSKLIPYEKYNFKPGGAQSQRHQNASIIHKSNSGLHLVPDQLNQGKSPSSQLRQDNRDQNYDPTKYSTFEDIPKNLVIMSDMKSGNMILCHQEHYLTTKKMENSVQKQKNVTKFIVSLIPRVALIPSISEQSGKVVDYTLVRSPAPNILDNRIRLWNTNDGRCLLASQKDMLVTKATKIEQIKNHPGNVLIIGEEKDVYVVNIYKMMVYKHFQYDIEGCLSCIFQDKNLVICEQSIGEDDEIPDNQVLAFYFINSEQVFIISEHRVDLYLQKTRNTIFSFSNKNKLIFAKFINICEREMLIVVNQDLDCCIFDLKRLRNEVQSHHSQKLNPHQFALVQMNLFENSRFFDHNLVKHEDHQNIFNDAESIKKEYIIKVREQLIKHQDSKEQQLNFRYSKSENVLYTFVIVENESKMVSWSFQTIFENLNYQEELGSDTKLPLFVNNIQLFPQAIENCPINFYSLVIKNIYNKHQFQFFFSDEKVTDSVTYGSSDNPALIIGTNYGRIFIVPMFQESDERVYPIILIDQHHQTPITQLFVAYDSSRRVRGPVKNSQNQQHPVKDNLYDHGGHLIGVSQDGTVSITNLNSGEINRALQNFNLQDKEKNRADQFITQVNENRKNKRRNSITQCFQMNSFFHMVKCKSQSVYDYSAFGKIEKIIEVKSITKLQEKILGINHHNLFRSHTISAERKSEFEDYSTQKRRGSFQGQNFADEYFQTHLSTYACISDDGSVLVLQISNLNSTLNKLQGMDSKAVGVYSNDELNQYYILTEKLNFYIYNRKSHILERKCDFKYAINSLYIKETVEYLVSKNECFKLATKSDHNVFDYESFERIFRRQSLLMGQGTHKILDYLSLSLNLPLQYHPHNMHSHKYTKVMQDILNNRQSLTDFSKKDEAQKIILRVINDSFFNNNLMYKSDFNDEYFYRQTGVTVIQTSDTIFRSKQQIIIANTKQIINVMRHKMQKIKNQKLQQNSQPGGGQLNKQKAPGNKGDQMVLDEDKEESKFSRGTITPKGRMSKKVPQFSALRNENIPQQPENEGLSKYKWPCRLLSLVHPFNIDFNVDENLERFFGLNLPFLDFRLGIQGADESFSFIISKEDEDYHSERNNISKMLRLLRLSKYSRGQLKPSIDFLQENARVNTQVLGSVLQFNTSDIDSEVPDRFFGSENWKISSYMSTIIPTFFLSQLVSIVEYSQPDITFLLQEWVYILQRINQQKTIHNSNGISLSVVSKILLKKDANISTTGRDIIMKPILYTIDTDQLKHLIDEWSNLIMETYKKLKKESSVKSNYGQPHAGNHLAVNEGSRSQSTHAQNQQQNVRKLINQYFGELEIRGLVNISFFALYYFDQLDHTLQYRVSKLTTILTREIVDKFDKNKKYINLLTLLLQILSIWMKSQGNQFNNKPLISEVIKLLLYIYNINKSALNKENVITRVTGQNFHLIKPTNPELYLKLTAARALLEIGENFTYDFLQLIQEEATHLQQSPEYQQNVLEVLKFFINGYGENLENHLIQLTQILLKCLDPNELALRKNSHKIISVILSIMVKMFPMVAFHHESQRLAVGTHDGPIAIYDVRTSAKWKILEGHSGNVTCLSFDSKGNLLASYSAVDLTLRLWKVGNTGFFSTIMGGTGKSANTIILEPLRNIKNPHHLLQMKKHQSVYQQDMKSNSNLLDDAQIQNQAQGSSQQSSGGSKRINKCSIKFILPKEKHVELVREDGVTTSHKLVK
ncbi:wd g-beta repeat-containing protein [Stylonychia lemnae]|uniref:Wd g-beta repeat-containing protein n=1 Tax=Stylonychia lemnae TaxID=5949 RepID=A0A078AMA0_STYLE|nr:wd g-beta repeat-containing protein [Stylonychia lemnae]|eukprot:CDW82512.1 wd g-beta repeat-containing protein [Stylonychia lemnae]